MVKATVAVGQLLARPNQLGWPVSASRPNTQKQGSTAPRQHRQRLPSILAEAGGEVGRRRCLEREDGEGNSIWGTSGSKTHQGVVLHGGVLGQWGTVGGGVARWQGGRLASRKGAWSRCRSRGGDT
jgi:hypothetical protein